MKTTAARTVQCCIVDAELIEIQVAVSHQDSSRRRSMKANMSQEMQDNKKTNTMDRNKKGQQGKTVRKIKCSTVLAQFLGSGSSLKLWVAEDGAQQDWTAGQVVILTMS